MGKMGQKAPSTIWRITAGRSASFRQNKPSRNWRTRNRGLPATTRGGLDIDGRGRITYEREQSSLFDGCCLPSPLHHGIQAR